jgi:DNA polymerase-3 subunit gamma/tau
MSYQVLARKWRPQTFHELVGQSHVKQALVNALTQNRLHHAYLFTGTRGVGKTTIARIFAKSLNCDEGISAEPCGRCSSCSDIEAGRYIDLLEIDAASRTKVEDTREILDNVQYAPTRGRYKVYLIDEVHMLSKHSFNALLKTLEEPPEHVKFLLATTDPQKLPVTILSRCLQFNLNALSQLEIKTQLEHVLTQEALTYDNDSLIKIAKAADGSMRDALSLTDQAIAQTGGEINYQAVQSMLGLMDVHYSQRLFAAILAQDATALITEVADVATKNPQYLTLLDDLIALTHLIQLAQLVPQAAELDDNNYEFINHVAQHATPQQIQIYYQLLLNGKKDLQWAPEARLGFEMIMLRLLAFEPSQPQVQNNEAQPKAIVASGKPVGASALRDIINKSKPVIDHTAKPKSDRPLEPVPSKLEPTVVNQKPAEKADKIPPRAVTPVPSPQSNEQSQRESEDAAYMEHSQVEQSLTAQFDDVMNSAVEQGFHPDETQVKVAPQTSTENISVNEQEAQAQSAIARILSNRNISGAGRLSGSKVGTDTPATLPENAGPSNASQKVLNNEKKPYPPVMGSQQAVLSKPERKVDFKIKHQTITENLAPELLEQINPQKAQVKQDNVPSIPIPDDFQSPISDIRFAHQQDEWAYLIKRMGLGGRMRQFALHSIFTKDDHQLNLQVDESQKHLDTPVLRQKLNHSLSGIYDFNVELNIEFEQGVIDSPFLIQQKIDAGRHQQAVDVINSDNNIIQFQQVFNAEIDENSIQAL